MVFKLGVTSLASLGRDRSWSGQSRRFALPLYGEIIESHPELDAFLPRILERHVSGTGAFKRTSDRRFAELDAIVARHAAELRGAIAGDLRVHDLGVSDGRSSVELLDRLAADGPVRFTASDRDPRVDGVRDRSGRWAVVFDEDGRVVQYAGRRFVVSPVAPENPILYPLNRLVLAAFERRLRPHAEALRRRALATPPADLERRAVDGAELWRIPLICRACLERMRSGEIRFLRHDVCEPLGERFHLLRAMNVLNHLGPEQLERAASRLWEGLEEGGLLVVGRSADPDGRTLATVWRREGGGLKTLDRLHGGAELAAAIEAAAGAPAGRA